MLVVPVSRPPLTVLAPPSWKDVTDEVGGENVPFTLGGREGALQLAPGVQQMGGRPNPSPTDMLAMCEEIAMQRGLMNGFDAKLERAVPLMAGMSFHAEDAFVRVWVVFDGMRFVAATYVCAWEARDVELGEAEAIVRSVKFM